MKIEKLLYEEIIFGGYGMPLINFCHRISVRPQDFAIELVKKYYRKDMKMKDFIKLINKKISKNVKKLKYCKQSKTFTFKVAGIKIVAEFICERTVDHCNIGSMLQKYRRFLENNVHRRTKQPIKSDNLWYLLDMIYRNPQVKLIGMKKKKVKAS